MTSLFDRPRPRPTRALSARRSGSGTVSQVLFGSPGRLGAWMAADDRPHMPSRWTPRPGGPGGLIYRGGEISGEA